MAKLAAAVRVRRSRCLVRPRRLPRVARAPETRPTSAGPPSSSSSRSWASKSRSCRAARFARRRRPCRARSSPPSRSRRRCICWCRAWRRVCWGRRCRDSPTAPLAEAASRVLGRAGRVLVLAGAAVSMFGYVSGDMLGSPRALFAFARDGMLPAVLARVHSRFHTPYVAIVDVRRSSSPRSRSAAASRSWPCSRTSRR